MFDEVISTGLQAVLAEVFESVDKKQLNVSLVGDIFKESHLELTDLRLKKTLLKDMNLPVDVKEGLVGKLVIQGLSGVMTGDPVTITVSEVLILVTPGEALSDPEAGLAARRLLATLREMFANRYAEDFLEDALGIKLEDKMAVQSQNKLNRKLLRHIVRKILAGVGINLQTVHVRFELPSVGHAAGTPVKPSAGVGGGGACDAVGVMIPNVVLRTCNPDHPAFAKFASSTPLERVVASNRTAGSSPSRRAADDSRLDKKNFCLVRKRATLSNLQVYCDYGVDSYVSAISAAVSVARNKATNPRPGTSGSLPGPGPASTVTNRGAAAAARAVRTLFQHKWKSERHALLFKPLGVEVGAEVHQWDKPGGKSIAPVYRVVRVNVGVGELQGVVDSEQGTVLGTVIGEITNLVRRARFNRFMPQAFLPLRNLPPPKVRPPKPAKDGAPAGMLPSVETWSWSAEIEQTKGVSGRPRSVSQAVLRGGFKKEGGAWARAMWRFAGACVRHDVRQGLTRKLPTSLTNWDGTITSSTNGGGVAATARLGDEQEASSSRSSMSWRVNYLRLHARTLVARDAKNLTNRVPDVRRLGVPRGREPLSLEEMWEMARVESFAPGDEVVFLRTAARVSSHFEWGRARRARAAAKTAAGRKGVSAEAVTAAAGKAAVAAMWTAKDDATVITTLDALRVKRTVAALAKKETPQPEEEEEEDEDDEQITQLQFAATAMSGFSDDDDESDSDTEDESDSEDDDDDGGGGGGGAPVSNGVGGVPNGAAGGAPRFSLADIAAKAKATTVQPVQTVVRTTGAVGGRKGGKGTGIGGEVWAKLLGLPRVVFEIESVGVELRTRISEGARKPLVVVSASGISGTMEGDETKRVLWWELRVGQLVFRDLCSSWGVGGNTKSASAAPTARTLLSGSASGVAGREWAFANDSAGAAARSFLVVRVVHDPNRFACGLFNGSAATLAELRTHVVLGCITGKIPPQVLAVFNAAARDIFLTPGTKSFDPTARNASSVVGKDVRSPQWQLRVTLSSILKAIQGPFSVSFRPKKRRGPSRAVRALSLARGAVAGAGRSGPAASPVATTGELDSKELYRVVAGVLPGDFEIRVHTSEVIVQVESRALDLLEAGKVALEAIGEDSAADGMEGGAAAAEGIKLEVSVAPLKVDACRRSHPSPELWVDTGIVRAKLRAPEKAVEAVVTALLSSAQKTKAAVALLSSAAGD